MANLLSKMRVVGFLGVSWRCLADLEISFDVFASSRAFLDRLGTIWGRLRRDREGNFRDAPVGVSLSACLHLAFNSLSLCFQPAFRVSPSSGLLSPWFQVSFSLLSRCFRLVSDCFQFAFSLLSGCFQLAFGLPSACF